MLAQTCQIWLKWKTRGDRKRRARKGHLPDCKTGGKGRRTSAKIALKKVPDVIRMCFLKPVEIEPKIANLNLSSSSSSRRRRRRRRSRSRSRSGSRSRSRSRSRGGGGGGGGGGGVGGGGGGGSGRSSSSSSSSSSTYIYIHTCINLTIEMVFTCQHDEMSCNYSSFDPC